MSNVYSFVAEKTGYKNVKPTAAQIPQLNLTGIFNGPLSMSSIFSLAGLPPTASFLQTPTNTFPSLHPTSKPLVPVRVVCSFVPALTRP